MELVKAIICNTLPYMGFCSEGVIIKAISNWGYINSVPLRNIFLLKFSEDTFKN